MSAQDLLLNNNFLIQLLAALVQQQQQIQQQQQQQQQLQQQQQQQHADEEMLRQIQRLQQQFLLDNQQQQQHQNQQQSPLQLQLQRSSQLIQSPQHQQQRQSHQEHLLHHSTQQECDPTLHILTQDQQPSSSLLAKLSAVTQRPNAHIVSNRLDSKMIDLLEAFYAINDNPEPAAIDMIARRMNIPIEMIADWFDKKRFKLNPFAGPRSPPARKREGGRVVTFSEYQRSLLEAIFNENNYLHPGEYEELSMLIQVPSRNIKIWFKNRRSKQRLSGRIATPCKSNDSS